MGSCKKVRTSGIGWVTRLNRNNGGPHLSRYPPQRPDDPGRATETRPVGDSGQLDPGRASRSVYRSRARRSRNGCAATAPRAYPGWLSHHHARTITRAGQLFARNDGSWRCGSPDGGDPTASATTCICPNRRSRKCWLATGCRCSDTSM